MLNGKIVNSIILLICFIHIAVGYSYADEILSNLIIHELEVTETSDISLTVSIVDADGSPKTNLDTSGFSVEDNGKLISGKELLFLDASEQQIGTIILVDVSDSMAGDKLANTLSAFEGFADGIRPNEKLSIIGFDNDLFETGGFSDDPNGLKRRTNLLEVGDRQAHLYDALLFAITSFDSQTDFTSKSIIVVADSIDAGSSTDIDRIVNGALDSNINIYTVGLVDKEPYNGTELEAIASDTYGNYFPPNKANNPAKALRSIHKQIQSQYYIEYRSEKVSSLFSGDITRDVKVSYSSSGISANSNRTYIASSSSDIGLYIIGIIAVIVLLILITVGMLLIKKKTKTGKTVAVSSEPSNNNTVDTREESSNELSRELISAATQQSTPITDRKTMHKRPARGLDTTFTLVVVDGPEIGRSYVLSSETVSIGRDANCDVVLISKDLKISRRHATISISEDEIVLSDNNSTNGTFVLSQESRAPELIDSQVIGTGDIIAIGPYKLKLQSGSAEDAFIDGEVVGKTMTIPSSETIDAALLILDIVGSTRFVVDSGDTMFSNKIVDIHNMIMKHSDNTELLFLKCTGDGVLGVFDSVAAAFSIANSCLDGTIPINAPVRMALHCGMIKSGPGGDPLGKEVHRAFRIEGVSGGGSITVDDKEIEIPQSGFIIASRKIVDSLPSKDGSPFKYLGDVELKGFEGTTEVWIMS